MTDMAEKNDMADMVNMTLRAAIESFITITEQDQDLDGQVARYKRLLRSISPHEVVAGIRRDEEGGLTT